MVFINSILFSKTRTIVGFQVNRRLIRVLHDTRVRFSPDFLAALFFDSLRLSVELPEISWSSQCNKFTKFDAIHEG